MCERVDKRIMEEPREEVGVKKSGKSQAEACEWVDTWKEWKESG